MLCYGPILPLLVISLYIYIYICLFIWTTSSLVLLSAPSYLHVFRLKRVHTLKITSKVASERLWEWLLRPSAVPLHLLYHIEYIFLHVFAKVLLCPVPSHVTSSDSDSDSSTPGHPMYHIYVVYVLYFPSHSVQFSSVPLALMGNW